MSEQPFETEPIEHIWRIADAWWNLKLSIEPMLATELGIKGHDHELPDISTESLDQQRSAARSLLEKAALLETADLQHDAALTLAVLKHDIEDFVARSVCRQECWLIDHLRGPQRWFLTLGQLVTIRNGADRQAYHDRLRGFDTYINSHIENLRTGLVGGLVAPQRQVQIVIGQLGSIASTPLDRDPLLIPAADSETQRLIAEVVRPAYRRYEIFLQDSVLPQAREEVGLWSLPIDANCYPELIRLETTLPLSPEEVFRIGEEETEAIHHEMKRLASHAFPGQDVSTVLKNLREDPMYMFASRDEVIALARATVSRARAALPRAFSFELEEPSHIEAIPPHAEAASPPGYFRPAAVDGSRPATYYVNAWEPRSRARYTSEALAFHECLPGHHLQTYFAQSQVDMPTFRRHLLLNVYVEGWAVYAERLADELGLYSDNVTRMGMLAYQAWRSARLVAETGIHAFGWSRTQAVDYMVFKTALTSREAENEVDRYVVWPGQGLAYSIGRTWIIRLRERAHGLGSCFSLPAFHEIILKNGALPLPLLEQEVDAWISRRRDRSPSI
jgi:uncharacterized protein (DUF885 family)